MSKKNKNQQNNTDRDELRTSKYPMPFPEVANMDDIGYYPDDLLADRVGRLEGERTRLLEMRYDPHAWEVELAYLRREQQIRVARAERHEVYMREMALRGHFDDDEVTHSPSYGAVSSTNSVVDLKALN
jgi:hypothetical protein